MRLYSGVDVDVAKDLGISPRDTTLDQISIFRRALEIFESKNNADGGYEDLWKQYGWADNLLHMRSKLSRIERRFRDQGATHVDLDDAYDLLNYVVFFIRNVLEENPNGSS